MTGLALIWFLKVVLLAGSALMAWKLYRTDLHRRYPAFFSYFLFRIPNSIWPFFFETSSATYQKIWICTDPIVLCFYILMVRELYRLVLEKYKGLYTLGRWIMYFAVAAAVTISGLTLLPRISPALPQRSKIMFSIIALDRGVNTALVVFLLVLLLFLSRYPVRLSSNVRVYAVLYTVFFLSNVMALLLRTVLGLRMADQFNTIFLGVSAACVVAWTILLNPKGSEAPEPAARLNPEYEHRLLGQLDTLNTALLRIGHR